MKEYILAINQHEGFPCQVVEKAVWEAIKEPKYCIAPRTYASCTMKDKCNCYRWEKDYERQKLSALQAGAVVEWVSLDLIPDVIPKSFKDGRIHHPTGVYELDPSRWAVQLKTQFCLDVIKDLSGSWRDLPQPLPEDWELGEDYVTRQIAIISPVETPKEEKPITADDVLGVFNSLPKREGFSGIKVIERDFVKEGEPILMMHPKDYEKMKKIVAFWRLIDQLAVYWVKS